METLITNDIKITVEPRYEPEYSNALEPKFIFSYHITIENLGREEVQLLRRHWQIWDSNGIVREVEGEGVVGEQPILQPGEFYSYSSWCQFYTPIGKMQGTYLMIRLSDQQTFFVDIPPFSMMAPQVLN